MTAFHAFWLGLCRIATGFVAHPMPHATNNPSYSKGSDLCRIVAVGIRAHVRARMRARGYATLSRGQASPITLQATLANK